jgi:hypothetical protein
VTSSDSYGPVLELHLSLLDELRVSGRLKADIRSARPLVESGKEINAADAPTRTEVIGAGAEKFAVLFVSTSLDASYIARSIANAARAKHMLGDDLGSVVLEPLAEGYFRDLSFALWPWHRPMTYTRGLVYFQRRLLSPRLLAWLRDAARRTARHPSGDELSKAFVQPLRQMARNDAFPADARNAALRGLERLASGAWHPRVTLQHKHVDHGNILLPRDRAARRRFSRGFILIDWAGANFSGYSFVNLLGLARNFKIPSSSLRTELLGHCDILSCEPCDIMSYLLAAFGFYRTQLGSFAEADYAALCRNILQYSQSALRKIDAPPG